MAIVRTNPITEKKILTSFPRPIKQWECKQKFKVIFLNYFIVRKLSHPYFEDEPIISDVKEGPDNNHEKENIQRKKKNYPGIF